MKLCVIPIILIIFLACGDNFDKKSKLAGLRILAISANTPEINSAGTVLLTPLISYVNGASANLNYTWEACPDPGIDFGANVSCDNSSAALKLSGAGTFSIATLAATHNTGNATTLSVAVPAAAFTYLATLNSKTKFNGLDYMVILKYIDQASGVNSTAIKMIKLSTKTSAQLNTNPTTGNIQFKGADLTSYPSSEGDMSVSNLSSSENYDLDTDIGIQTKSENMFVSWYSSTGKFLFNRSKFGEKNTFTPDGNTGVFVIIYRDSRGGVTSNLTSF